MNPAGWSCHGKLQSSCKTVAPSKGFAWQHLEPFMEAETCLSHEEPVWPAVFRRCAFLEPCLRWCSLKSSSKRRESSASFRFLRSPVVSEVVI